MSVSRDEDVPAAAEPRSEGTAGVPESRSADAPGASEPTSGRSADGRESRPDRCRGTRGNHHPGGRCASPGSAGSAAPARPGAS
ncbi:hypothetical protein, partial [Saccharopolyspora erythraea]|uniref:hypothetical protein n=1 Tax=Saccharopolyspora erythraea TaxID=1836 RepID=UPI0031F96D65